MEILPVLVIAAVIAALVLQLNRTERRRRDRFATPYLHPLDRDAQRVHDEVTARARADRDDLDAAARRRRLAREWTRHA